MEVTRGARKKEIYSFCNDWGGSTLLRNNGWLFLPSRSLRNLQAKTWALYTYITAPKSSETVMEVMKQPSVSPFPNLMRRGFLWWLLSATAVTPRPACCTHARTPTNLPGSQCMHDMSCKWQSILLTRNLFLVTHSYSSNFASDCFSLSCLSVSIRECYSCPPRCISAGVTTCCCWPLLSQPLQHQMVQN